MKSVLFLLIITFPVLGQVAKRPLTEADYKLWSTMDVEQLSDVGNWVSYSLHYESGQDTLFVKHTKTLKTYAFAGGTDGRFAKEQLFVCQGQKGQLILTHLSNGKRQELTDISAYTTTQNKQYLIVQQKNVAEKQKLLITDLEGKPLTTISDVTFYSYNAKADTLVCDSAGQILLYYLTIPLKKNIIASDTKSIYSDIVWQKSGASFAYFSHDAHTKIGYYRLNEKQLYTFDPSQFDGFPANGELYNASGFDLTISDDGTKVFFGVKPKDITQDTTGVQLWNTADKSLYPEKRLIKGWAAVPKVGMWFPVNNQFTMLTDNEFPNAMLTGDQKHALLFNPIANEPQFAYSGPIDFYLSNLITGERQLILPKQSSDESKVTVSGKGKYIAYFKDKQWWVYDVLKNTHRNLTQAIGVSFERDNYGWSGEIDACGIAGWNADDTDVLLYDNYDVWLVKTDGSGFTRLTHGREEHVVYRVVPQSKDNSTSTNYNWTQKGTFNLSDGLVFKAKSDSMSGYFKWDLKKGLQKLVFNANRVSIIKVSKTNDVSIYVEEHYHQSPKLVVHFKKSNQSKLLFESNPQQKNYQWGFSKLITYENTKGEILQGALFYPAGFTLNKSYPMVVQIYEHLSDHYNEYVNPSLLNDVGFNISNFTTRGYFVLLPDIVKEEGNTGRSAVDCVESAVREVLAHESVDPKRLGLVGHSFGGYQTNFIITQTNMFAAAVSSAGASDIISDYLYVAWNSSRPNGYRYEFHQASIGVSPFEDYEKYLKNSPITYAKNVQTPLLLWSGEDDKQVHYFQSLEFHLALRRLQKPNILLLYEGERHTIRKRDHQIDLARRFKDWFDYYLKDDKRPEWVTPDKL